MRWLVRSLPPTSRRRMAGWRGRPWRMGVTVVWEWPESMRRMASAGMEGGGGAPVGGGGVRKVAWMSL